LEEAMKKYAICLLVLLALVIGLSTGSLGVQRRVLIEYFTNTG
jgi:hypothetical protein